MSNNNRVTTTRSGFRVEDVTFRNARRQSEIVNELGLEEEEDDVLVEAPKSLTPEQVIRYYETLIKNTQDLDSKRVYSQTIKWIKELQEAKQKLVKVREREIIEEAKQTTPDDIEEDVIGEEDD